METIGEIRHFNDEKLVYSIKYFHRFKFLWDEHFNFNFNSYRIYKANQIKSLTKYEVKVQWNNVDSW